MYVLVILCKNPTNIVRFSQLILIIFVVFVHFVVF